MAKRDAVPKTQAGYLQWHDNLKKNVTATTTGCTADDVTMLAADNADLHAKMDAAATADNADRAAHAELTQSIGAGTANARALAQRIKKSTGYTTAIGDQLQIEGPENSVDMTQQAPVLDTTAKAGGVVEVGFNKMGAEGVHIYSQRDGDAAFAYLSSETLHPMWTTGPWLRRASRRRANTRPCSSSANPKSSGKRCRGSDGKTMRKL
jgi:hypothetical protein